MIAPLSRIILRYMAMALIAHGWLSDDVGNSIASDPDLQVALGGLIAAGVEGYYALAHRFGWAK